MTLPIHDRSLPPYVHDLVVEAGRDSVFWASARDPGERPDTGGSMSEWRNRVVGSSQEATQSTASDQPIWRGDRLEFAGDDFFNADYDPGASSQFVAILVWQRDVGTSQIELIGAAETSGAAPFFDVLSPDDADLRTRARDANGNGPNANDAGGLALEGSNVSGHRIDWANDIVEQWTLDGDGSGFDKVSGSASMTQPSDPYPTAVIGARPNLGNFFTGSFRELLLVSGTVTEAEIKDIMSRLKIKWDV